MAEFRDEGDSEWLLEGEGEEGRGEILDPLSNKGTELTSSVLSGVLRASSISSCALEIERCVP